MRRPWLALSVIALAVAAPRAARAEASLPVHLQYDAPEGCPASDAFVSQVQARTARMRLAEEGETGLTLRVTVVRAESRVQGTLVVVDTNGTETRRDVRGDSCAAVTVALALVAALRIDPTAPIGALPAESASSTLPSAVPPAATPQVPDEAPSAAALSSPPPLASTARRPERSELGARSRVHFTGALGLDILGFVPQSAILGATLLGQIALDGRGVLAPEARVGASLTESQTLRTKDGTGVLMWSRGLIEVCPLRFELAATLDVRPCVTSAAGGLHAEGHGTGTSAPPKAEPWLEIGGAALLEWRLVGPLAVQGEAGFSLPLSRETFFFQQSPTPTTVYQAPPIVGEARLALAVHFL